MKTFKSLKKFRNIPQIDFINYKLAFAAYSIIALIHVFSKLGQQQIDITLPVFATFFLSLLIPNLLTLFAVKYSICFLNRTFGDSIPLALFLLVATFMGAVRGELVVYIEHQVRIVSATEILVFGPFVRWFNEPAHIVNGALLGFITAIGVAFYAVFANSALKVQNSIVSSSERLHLQIDELETGMINFEQNVQQKIYEEVLGKIDLSKVLSATNSDMTSDQLSNVLRGTVVERVRAVSAILISKPKKNRFSIMNNRFNSFVNLNSLNLHPLVFCVSNIAITFGYNTGVGLKRDTWVVLVNSVTTFLLLVAINKFLLPGLQNKISNVEIVFSIAALMSLICELNAYIMNEPLPLLIRLQRFAFFVVLIRLISFVINMAKIEDFNTGPHAVMVSELREKLEYLENAYSEMQREIAEHLHGYLIFQLNEIAGRMRKENLSPEELAELMEQVKTSFSYEKFSILRTNFSLDMPTLFRLAKEWEGLIEVVYSGDTSQIGLLPEAQKREVWNVIVELINNAFRHGDSSKIEIDFNFADKNFLRLCAVDNGSGLTNYPSKGTGSKIFSVASDNNWEISSLPEGGARVALQIEFYAKSIDDLIPAKN